MIGMYEGGCLMKVWLLGMFVMLCFQLAVAAVSGEKIIVSLATAADFQGCLDLLLANRSFYNPLMEALNREKGCNLSLLTADDFAVPEVRQNILPVSKPYTEVMVARLEEAGPIVGFVIFQEQKRTSGNVLLISRLNVAEAMRGKGVGKALFAKAVDFCDRHPGITRVAGRILANNKAMLRLIQVCGFRYTHESTTDAYIPLEVSVVAFRAYTKGLL